MPNAIAGRTGQRRIGRSVACCGGVDRSCRADQKYIWPVDAIDADGNLVKFQESEIGKKYLNLRSKAAGSRGGDALKVAIFNHLYSFFSRYYQEGDFISKRRYSKNQRYAIPYNGEEVYLYWANSDQYYIKTAEYFHDYTYKAPNGITVHFKVQAADVEQDNVKGDKRFFLPCAEAITYDEKVSWLEIPFEYRPLTAQEEITYGKKNQQETILTHALRVILDQFKKTQEPLSALTAEKSQNSDGEPITLLEHHLRQYTRRNTSDYFIHKDLKGFLSRELDFYLKNEVLSLDEMEAAGEDRTEGWFQMMRIIKSIGGQITDFLNQIENFQKMLWEKRKFVIETQYCITIGHIDEDFHQDIAGCEAQWDEWKELFAIDEDQIDLFTSCEDKIGKRVEFLKARPTLVLDTRHFDQDFMDRLVASFDDLDGMTDGLLIHSENWQALNLLSRKYSGQIKCIHLDPPYNTQTSGFLYKNNYQHSSWLAFMFGRYLIACEFLHEHSSLICHIDEYEMERLHLLFDAGPLCNAGTLVWDKGMPVTGASGLATQHEYALWRTLGNPELRRKKKHIAVMQAKAQELLQHHGSPNSKAQSAFRKWLRSRPDLSKAEQTYNTFDDNGHVFRSDNMSATDRRTHEKFYVPLYHPVTKNPCPVPEYDWRYTPETMNRLLKQNLILFGRDHTVMPRKKTLLEMTDSSQLSTIYKSGKRGKTYLDDLFLEFPFSHPVDFYTYILDAASERTATILDYFAGSGTTGHAIINLNREDGGQRKFILVEMGEYFDTVLVPRIKKVTFTPEWKKGKPKRMATLEEAKSSPRIVKYMRLESYEDALNNIAFDEASNQMALEFDDYLLKYMLKWETRASETLLNVEKLTRPFCYKMHIRADGQTREKVADIPETFNYLMGLYIETRRVYDDDGRNYLVYRGQTCEGRKIAVIWRETEGWQKSDFERDKDFVADQKFSEGVDEIFVNGDSFIQEAKALEPMFKARMFAETGV